MKKKLPSNSLFLLLLGTTLSTYAQVKVDINFDINHKIGSETSFDREKYITIHADNTEGGFNGEIDKMDYLINDLDTYLGRATGSMKFQVNQLDEDPNRPGFATPSQMTSKGNTSKNNYGRFRTDRHPFEKGDWITAAQDNPFYPNEVNTTGKGWKFSTTDTPTEPFGTALGEFMGRYLRDYHGTGGSTGPVKPKWVEVMNEPVWPLVERGLHGGGTLDNIFKMHSSVADQIKIYSPDSKVGGFCTAFPDLEKNNFAQWDERWKRFIDEVGPKMDFYSIHLYDFPGISGGKEQYRKGGHMEATMDMIEQYNTIKYGSVKPWVISEYGSQVHDWYNQPWSPYRDWLMLKSFSAMTLQFMERPDLIKKVIPFAIAKAEWGRSANNIPYYWRLMRRADEPINDPNMTASGPWVWTEVIKYYELWSDVKGTRVDSFSTDLDLMVDAYVDNNKAYLIMNNIDEGALTVDTNELGLNGNTISSIKIKHLYIDTKGTPATTDDVPVLDIQTLTTMPTNLTIGDEACMIIEYTFNANVTIDQTSEEEKKYATTYKQPIVANQTISFTIPNISKGTEGEGVLRLGVGRALSKERKPVVTVNGTSVIVPADYRGDNQEDKNSFFTVLEIPVPYSVLNVGDNIVNITFSDTGGFVSTCALQTFDMSRSVTRSDNSRPRTLTLNNKAALIPSGETNPVFDYGTVVPLDVFYATEITNQEEEDLTYIAARIREYDTSGTKIKESAFKVIRNGNSSNSGTFNTNYTIPEKFTDDTDIPNETELTAGHRLELFIVMAVDGATGFATATSTIHIREGFILSNEFFEPVKKDMISVYPVPTSGILNISGAFEKWEIYSLSGALVKKGTETPIDISDLSRGMYYISLDSGKTNYRKFIKE